MHTGATVPHSHDPLSGRELRHSLTLRFAEPLESRFEADAGRMRCRRLVARGAVALLIYDLFAFADWQVLPDIFPIALLLRLGVGTPLAVILLVVVWFQPRVWIREAVQLVFVLGAAATPLGLMLLSDAPYRVGQHHAIILVVLFATVVQRIRFPYAVAGCAGCLLMHALALAALPEYPHELELLSNMILGGAVVLGLVAAYALERDSRLAYLNAMRERGINAELAMLSRHDSLTGLANRRSLDETLGEMERTPIARDLAAVLFDVDNFKLFNDSLGHPAGDVCLMRIAGILRAELRERGDLAFRFGGEEFLVVLPDTGLAAAIAIAERVRQAVADAAIPHPATPSGRGIVTVSAGTAAAMLGDGLRAAEIIAGADAALYAAKRNGRNQVWPPFLAARRAAAVEALEPKAKTG